MRLSREGLAGTVVLTWVLCVPWVSSQASGPWTLAGALEEALAGHPDAEEQRARLAAAEAAYREAAASLLPRVDVKVNYMQTTNPMQGFGSILSQGSFDNSLDFNDPGQLDGLTGALEGRYRIYSGGARKAGIDAAAAMREAGEYRVKAAEHGLEDAVVGAYFGIKQADEIVRSIEAGIRVLEENVRVSKVREETGELIRTERLNLEVQLAAMERERLGAEHGARLARFRLGYLLGLPPGTEIELASGDPSVEGIRMPPEMSIRNRPELQAAEAGLEAAAKQVKGARAGHLPSVDAYASWQADKGWRREGDGTSWTAGLVLSLPVFDGFTTRAQVAGAKARERVAAEQLRRMELAFEVELEEARLGHELARAQKEVARKQVSQAEEAAELSRERFAAGTLLSTELIGVESRLVDARVQLALATARERTALAHLRRVAGYPVLD
ncbi:MAG: TolC family protein [Oceanipulchritudo sp.]